MTSEEPGPYPVDASRLSEAMIEVATLMDRLRSPGGCPWDREQTNESLAPYVIEEAHEVAEAAERGSGTELREELGDLFLQVLFHARVAQEAEGADRFDLADVAEGLSAKLRRRHPHVFGGEDGRRPVAADPDAVNRQWDAIKRAERAGRSDGGRSSGAAAPSVLDGVPSALPALMRGQKILRRAQRAGIAVGPTHLADPEQADLVAREEIGADLLAILARAEAQGVDAEAALRDQIRGLVDQVRAAES